MQADIVQSRHDALQVYVIDLLLFPTQGNADRGRGRRLGRTFGVGGRTRGVN